MIQFNDFQMERVMPEATRITDMHICPQSTPTSPPTPHVGGPIIGPGVPTVLIGGIPAAAVGDACVCFGGEPDTIIKGSSSVLIGGRPAVRKGDATSHGGTVVFGLPTVIVGG